MLGTYHEGIPVDCLPAGPTVRSTISSNPELTVVVIICMQLIRISVNHVSNNPATGRRGKRNETLLRLRGLNYIITLLQFFLGAHINIAFWFQGLLMDTLCTLRIRFTIMQSRPFQFEFAKGRFTRYDFVACNKLTTGLRNELFRVNQTYNSLTTVIYVTKKAVGF